MTGRLARAACAAALTLSLMVGCGFNSNDDAKSQTNVDATSGPVTSEPPSVRFRQQAADLDLSIDLEDAVSEGWNLCAELRSTNLYWAKFMVVDEDIGDERRKLLPLAAEVLCPELDKEARYVLDATGPTLMTGSSEDHFFRLISSSGFRGPQHEVLRFGFGICGSATRGASVQQIIEIVEDPSQHAEFVLLLDAAAAEMCPEFADHIMAASALLRASIQDAETTIESTTSTIAVTTAAPQSAEDRFYEMATGLGFVGGRESALSFGDLACRAAALGEEAATTFAFTTVLGSSSFELNQFRMTLVAAAAELCPQHSSVIDAMLAETYR